MYSIDGIEERNISGENLSYILWYLKKIVVKTLLIMFIILKEDDPVINPFNTPFRKIGVLIETRD